MDEPDMLGNVTLPPSRLRWRKRIFIGLLVLAPIGSILGIYFRFSMIADRELQEAIAEADRLDPGWRLHELEAKRKVIPDAENSALTVLAAKRLIPPSWPAWDHLTPPVQKEQLALQRSFTELEPQRQLDEGQIIALRVELQKAAPALAEARKLADLPNGRYVVTWKLNWLSTSLPCQDARQVTTLLSCDALLQAQEGNVSAAFASCRGVLNAGRSIGDEPFTISQLVRIVCREIALKRMERILAQGAASDTVLSEVQKLLEDEEANPLLLMAMRGDRAFQHRMLQAVREGTINDPELAKEIGKIDHARMLKVMTQLVEVVKLPKVEQNRQTNQLMLTLDRIPLNYRTMSDVYLELALPALWKVSESFWRSRAQLRCAVVAIAIERYRMACGCWPDSLAVLVPEQLLKLPTDPYDGKPLRFRRIEDGMVVYAVGPDLHDNGGKFDRKNLIAAGSDLGFRLWDVHHRRQPPAELLPEPREEVAPPSEKRARLQS